LRRLDCRCRIRCWSRSSDIIDRHIQDGGHDRRLANACCYTARNQLVLLSFRMRKVTDETVQSWRQAVCGRTKTRPAKPCIFRPTAFGLPAEPAARPPPPALTAGTLDDVTMSRFASSVLQRYIGSVSLPAILFLYMLHAN
jgi:hypothetical protein